MFGKLGLGVFLKLPVGDAAFFAGPPHPFVPEPVGGAAVFGVAGHEGLAAVGRDDGVIPFIFDAADAVEGTVAGRPELDLFQQTEKIDVLAVIAFVAFGGHIFHLKIFKSASGITFRQSCRIPIRSGRGEGSKNPV